MLRIKELAFLLLLSSCGSYNGNDATFLGPIIIVSVPGPAGPEGQQGPSGKDGSAGKDGTNGSNGSEGPKGSDGKDGQTGSRGETGPKGETGAQGPAGVPAPISIVIGQGNLSDCQHGYTLFADGTFIAYESSASASASNNLGSWRVLKSAHFAVLIGSQTICTNMHFELEDGQYWLYYQKISNGTQYKFRLDEFNAPNSYADRPGIPL